MSSTAKTQWQTRWDNAICNVTRYNDTNATPYYTLAFGERVTEIFTKFVVVPGWKSQQPFKHPLEDITERQAWMAEQNLTPEAAASASRSWHKVGSDAGASYISVMGDVVAFSPVTGSDPVFSAKSGRREQTANEVPNLAYLGWDSYVTNGASPNKKKRKAAWVARISRFDWHPIP